VPSGIEIHDSTLAGIMFIGRDLVARLVPAYIHKSAGRPGIDQGTGWLQEIDLVISEAVVERVPSELPDDLMEGALSVGEVRWDSVMPLPLAASGQVTLTAVTSRGQLLSVRGVGISAVVRGVARCIEGFPDEAYG
jgi:hypothetical protein